MKQPDVLLADASGRVVFDSAGKVKGKLLNRREIANAWPIMEADDREPIGYLLLFYSVTEPVGELEQKFLDNL